MVQKALNQHYDLDRLSRCLSIGTLDPGGGLSGLAQRPVLGCCHGGGQHTIFFPFQQGVKISNQMGH